jgi:NADPH-dependent 2,4-dienoyl-CoA reductase/sulfur reductase-like enzyme/rhodanese-related sulfurtransferase
MSKRIVVVGGVAAGAAAAAKARRTSEDVEIVVIEAGPYISFANCGLPYYVGGEIERREKLFVVNPARFARRYRLDVRTNTRAASLDRDRRCVRLRLPDGGEEDLPYDRLILATGAVAIRPPIEGLDRANVFTVRTVPDADAITEHLAKSRPGRGGARARATVIGGGYIGLETAEQLLRRGLTVTVVEMADQLMLPLDAEMAEPLQAALLEAGCDVVLGDAVSRIIERKGESAAVTAAGREIPFDVGILAVGVRPNVELVEAAGIELGPTGAIRVDRLQRTSDPAVYAAGDNSEAVHLVTGRAVNTPLAGPATKAGRAAGANAALDLMGAGDDDPRRLELRGVLGTAIVRVCGTVAGVTGLTEKDAQRFDMPCEVSYMFGESHARYYPGAAEMLLKIVYDGGSGRLLGAQAVGSDGVDKRIDVLATAISAAMTIEDIEQLDLCYAPPFGSARDVTILGGFAGANARRGLMPAVTPSALLDKASAGNPWFLLDVRTPREFDAGNLDGAVNIPVDELRKRLDEVPAGKPVLVYCATGYRSYVAQRILMDRGWRHVRNLLGGYELVQQVRRSRRKA